MLASRLTRRHPGVRMALNELDQEILAFEESWWTVPGVKSTAIREQLGISPTHYYDRLARLTDTADALAHSPLLVRRMRRRRVQRRRERFEGAVQPQWPRH